MVFFVVVNAAQDLEHPTSTSQLLTRLSLHSSSQSFWDELGMVQGNPSVEMGYQATLS